MTLSRALASLSKPKHPKHALSHYISDSILAPYAPGYSFLAEFAKAPDLLPLQGFLPEPIRGPNRTILHNSRIKNTTFLFLRYIFYSIESDKAQILRGTFCDGSEPGEIGIDEHIGDEAHGT